MVYKYIQYYNLHIKALTNIQGLAISLVNHIQSDFMLLNMYLISGMTSIVLFNLKTNHECRRTLLVWLAYLGQSFLLTSFVPELPFRSTLNSGIIYTLNSGIIYTLNSGIIYTLNSAIMGTLRSHIRRSPLTLISAKRTTLYTEAQNLTSD